ncbi:hypothetical protein ACWGLF_30870 [Streptomyces puniciscabiei]
MTSETVAEYEAVASAANVSAKAMDDELTNSLVSRAQDWADTRNDFRGPVFIDGHPYAHPRISVPTLRPQKSRSTARPSISPTTAPREPAKVARPLP